MTRFLPILTAAATTALVLTAVARPMQAQSRGEHWVGTWATAVVVRPQPGGVPAPPPGFGVPVPAQCFGQAPAGSSSAAATVATTAPPAAAPQQVVPAPGGAPTAAAPGGAGRGQAGVGGRGGAPPLNFTNQTLRQIVHASLA